MTRSDRKDPETRSRRERSRGKPRPTRSIPFSDSEWNLIQYAAARYGLPAEEIVRSGALAFAENRLSAHSTAALSPGHVSLIEATYCAVHQLSAALTSRETGFQVRESRAGAAYNAMLANMKQEPIRAVLDRPTSPAGQKRDDETRYVPGGSRKFFYR